MNRGPTMLLAISAALVLGCEAPAGKAHGGAVESQTAAGTRSPDAGDPEDRLHDTGGADPTAVSGRAREADEETIHHPGADGNAGRPPDERGSGAARSAGSGTEPHSTMETH